MRYRKAGFDDDGSLARELAMWVNNDAQVYRQLESIQRNMTRKMAQDKFDPELAVQSFMWAAESGAKSYAKEFGGSWFEIFPKNIRRMAAEILRDEFMAEVDVAPAAYEHHVFKKDVNKWRERYPRESSVRRAARGGYNQEAVKAALEIIYDVLDSVFEGNAVNEWERAYEYLNDLDSIVRDYGYALDR